MFAKNATKPVRALCRGIEDRLYLGLVFRPDGFKGWHKIVRNRKIAVNAGKMRLVWHVFAIRGNEAIDTFTGEAITAAGLVITLFGK